MLVWFFLYLSTSALYYPIRDLTNFKYFNAWAGTPLEYGRMELPKWIYAAYLLMTARKGISSLQLSKELEVTQTTVWYILHRLRIACGGDMETLRGVVEVDEVNLGGRDGNKQ